MARTKYYTLIDIMTDKSESHLTSDQIRKILNRPDFKVSKYCLEGRVYKKRWEIINDPQFWFDNDLYDEWEKATYTVKKALEIKNAHN